MTHTVELSGRWVAAISSLAVAAGALTGCGGGTGADTTGAASQAPALPTSPKVYTDAEISQLIAQMTNSDSGYTLGSAPYLALKAIGLPAFPLLVATLQDPSKNTDSRKWCADLVGEVGQLQPALAVLNGVINDKSGLYQWWHQAEAQSGLRSLFSRQSTAVVLPYFEDANPAVRSAAIGSFRWKPRDAAVFSLALQRMLHDPDSSVRWTATDVLAGLVGAKDDYRPFLAALGDTDSMVRWSAIEALSAIGDRLAVTPLLGALASDADYIVRAAAARALGHFDDMAATPALLVALAGDAVAYVRSGAALALGTLRDPSAVQPLIGALQQDEDDSVRAAAAGALGQIGDASAIPALQAVATGDRSDWVRSSASTALNMLGKGG